MRIGLISDIHADLDNLLAALEILKTQGADEVLCAGDIVEKGSQGDAVVAVLRAKHIACIKGNHDEMAIENQAWLRENGDPSNPNYEINLLGERTLEFLWRLPAELRFTWQKARILLAHGTPASNLEYLYPHVPASVFRQVAADSDADLIILGHTHQPMRVRVGNVLIVNPGAVSPEGSRTCATLDLPGAALRVFSLATGQELAAAEVANRVIE